ncbi:MAG: penicillin-binding protein 2 [Bacteroidia bacterium]|nr:penicillin-binding protein 2 [Bacteroidia bacterium]NND24899.1 penicillin-binding protein 2 [Flavobacteriaceae bacterium]MBT8279062.1 penicillin-binding protein 2 [Bacteroidia bacterium]NNK59962.1 penicillin-binding protein 2 [Flavobacteriaceae bacterium]NNL33085.1 penicillin-binding protein 2 [Flavobacteriaceae bacterium]
MRKLLLFLTVLFVGLIFVGRLFYLQVYAGVSYDINEDNAIRKVYNYPKRGYVYDRNGELLVANQPSYDVMVIPREVEPLDTMEFCSLLKISKQDFIKSYKRANNYSPRLPSVFLAHLSKEDYAVLSEKMRKFHGFYIQKRSLRDYQTSIGANVLGFIAEANRKTIEKDPFYKMGDLIGKQGVELSYETELRGVKGVKYIQKDRFNRDIGPYKNGNHDIQAEPGKDITISIDAELQAYGERLMQNKRGGIVAIEPKTGEILSLVSAPTYNPNLLVGRERSKNYTKLYNDTISRPLIDRGLLRMHEPGSPFKALIALTALQEGVIDEQTKITCKHGYVYGRNNRKMGCHCGGGIRYLNNGISKSCNAYFANAFRKTIEKYDDAGEAMDIWSDHIKSFGLGNFLGYDLPIGKKGNIPNGAYYDKWYPDFRWGATTIISNAIGQGEVLVTPIQLANMMAAIANRGYYYTPHIIKNIKGSSIPDKFKEQHHTSIDKEHFGPVIQGLFDVFESRGGTANFLKVPGIEICGKTGTAENFIKIDSVRTQLTDHSIFVAFAPKDDPKIAIAVFVENGYYGARWAGRISSLMIEQYIKGEVTLKYMEKMVLEKSLEEEYLKPYSGQPFKINQ